MFVDKVRVIVKAGDGGNGIVNFRHEKFIDRGGPDGGDGGNGGNVILRGSRNQNTLATFRYQKLITAESGQAGSKRKKHGKAGQDLMVDVPVGTIIISDEGQTMGDLIEDGQEVIIARGGRGGFGNAHFTSSVRQAPRLAEKGERGDSFEAMLELKLIADVGLVGLPNAGKSTLLAAVSHAKPEIADYPFTTLRPNLGVVDLDDKNSLLMADIPGLIEGASQGKGLGVEFLRHVERTNVLLHLVDVYQEDVAQTYQTVQKELTTYAVNMSKRPQIVVLSKIDGVDPGIIKEKLAALEAVVPARTQLFTISAQSHTGIKELLYAAQAMVVKDRAKTQRAAKKVLPVIRLDVSTSWRIEQTDKGFVVSGRKIERFAERTDFTSQAAVARLRDIMKKMGIAKELKRKGAEAGQPITIKGYESIPY